MALEIPVIGKGGGTNNPVYPGKQETYSINKTASYYPAGNRQQSLLENEIQGLTQHLSRLPIYFENPDGSRIINTEREEVQKQLDQAKMRLQSYKDESWNAARKAIADNVLVPQIGKSYDATTGKLNKVGMIDDTGSVNTNKLVNAGGKTYERDKYGSYTEFRG